MTPATPTSIITDATANLQTQLLEVLPIGLGIAVTLLVVFVGWRFVRRFVH